MGGTIVEAIGPPNKIVAGCMTVMIGDSGMGGSQGAALVAAAASGAALCET
jgi:hypothetical protein